MNNPTLKIQIIEGIKFPIVITDLYLKALIGLIKKRLHRKHPARGRVALARNII